NVDLKAQFSIVDVVDVFNPYDPWNSPDDTTIASRPRINVIGNSITLTASLGTVGTANIDYRSFYVNFELNLISRRMELADILSENFLDDIKLSKEVTGAAWQRRGLASRFPELVGWLARKFL
ncbi:MAG: hypothetical protein KY410_03930, partial [Proteobacteria bacterium]|nr:hypothetical protein [Pseudomonadota bacterium]